MTILENIGLIAIIIGLFFTGKYVYNYFVNQSKEFNEKATILVQEIPELKEYFENFRKNQKQLVFQENSRMRKWKPDHNAGVKQEIFGVSCDLLEYNHSIQKEIKRKIKASEKYAIGAINNNKIIKSVKLKRSKIIKAYQIEIAEIELKHSKYYDFLKTIFPNSKIEKDKNFIINELITTYQVSENNAEIIFKDLNQNPKMIFEDDKTGLFHFYGIRLSSKTRELKEKIDELSLKYH